MLGSPAGLTRKFLFRGGVNFLGAEPRFPKKLRPGASTAAHFALAATSLWAMDLDLRPGNRGLFRPPLPIIGVRRALMQGGAHDDAPCDDHSRTAGRVFFRPPGGVAGFVDSGPKTPMPSASNRSTPEWTLVDSCGLRASRAGRRAGRRTEFNRSRSRSPGSRPPSSRSCPASAPAARAYRRDRGSSSRCSSRCRRSHG
jgi:hypothetical protein